LDNYQVNIIDDIAVVKVDIASATLRDAQSLWDKMESDSLFDRQKIVIDLTFCTFVDSTFIGMIVKVFKKVSEKNNQMKLVFPQITDLESFRVIGIVRILECFSSVQDAIDSFNPESTVQKINIDQQSPFTSI